MKTAKSSGPLIPGVTVAMGGSEWTIPPLTLGNLRRLMPKIQKLTEIGASMGEAQIAILVEVVAAAMARNYPSVTPAQLEDLLDMGNANNVLTIVLTGSGLKQGEQTAVATSSGEKYTASSRPPADTVTP